MKKMIGDHLPSCPINPETLIKTEVLSIQTSKFVDCLPSSPYDTAPPPPRSVRDRFAYAPCMLC